MKEKTEKNTLRQRIKSLFQESANFNTYILVAFIVILTILSITQLLTHLNFLKVSFFIVLLTVVWVFFAKDVYPKNYPTTKQKKRTILYVNMLIVAFGLLAFDVLDIVLKAAIGSISPKLTIFMSGFMFITAIISILMLVLTKNVTFKVKLVDFNIYKSKADKDKETAGDIIVGEILDKTKVIDEDGHHAGTGKYLTIPYNDRYVHLSVFGPTGSGKTSQVLGPMSLQDIQNKEMGVFVLEPKGDFDEVVYARAKLYGRKHVQYFNPVLPKCPYFNPLQGDETEVMENLVTAFSAMDNTKTVYFKNLNEMLLRNCIKTVKRLYGDDATFKDITNLMDNLDNKGSTMVEELKKKVYKDQGIMNENNEIYAYFKNDYYAGLKGAKGAPKTFTDSSGIRAAVKKLTSNKYLAKVLIPPKTSELKEGEYLDFDKALERGDVICMSSAQGALRDMGTYLGYFLILSLQSAIFRRPGTADTRRGAVLYIDEAQKYANNSMEDLLTQGRSYRIACVFATQNRALLDSGGDSGKRFLNNVSTNMRNTIVFPGASPEDAKYFSAVFGTEKVIKHKETYSNRAYVPKIVGFDSARVNTSDEEVDQPVFSQSDIQEGAFGEIKVKYIKNNNVKKPELIGIKFVDKEIDQKAKKYLDELYEGQTFKSLEDAASKETIRANTAADREIQEMLGLDDVVDDEIDIGFDEDISDNDSDSGSDEEVSKNTSSDDHEMTVIEDLNNEFEDEEELEWEDDEF